MHMIQHEGWTLVHKETGKPVAMNEKVEDFRGDKDVVIGGRPPHKPSSTGHVWVKGGGEFYPSVFGLKWVNEVEEERMAVIEYAVRAPDNEGLRTIIRYRLNNQK